MNMRKICLSILALFAALLALPALASAGEDLNCTKATLTEDGLHMQPWFIQDSFLDLKEELQRAKEQGKRFVVIMEVEGCPYCAMMHAKYLTNPKVCAYLRKHFAILQMNKKGSREVTDFDGSTLPENKWLKKYKAFFTPNIMIFDDDVEHIAGKPPLKRIVARMDGPGQGADFFLALFQYAYDKGYEKGSFINYLMQKAKKDAKQG